MNKYDQQLFDIMANLKLDINNDQKQLSKEECDLIAVVSLVVQGSSKLLENTILELTDSLSPIQIKEAVFQCAPYIGYGKVLDSVEIINDCLEQKGVSLELEPGATVTTETRFDSGVDAQVALFGQQMRDIATLGDKMPRESKLLASNCFGDFYTRNGLSLETREMLTLAILVNLGTEPQIKAHIGGNLHVGRSPQYIEEVMFGCLVYCGYPRLLNAKRCLQEVLASIN